MSRAIAVRRPAPLSVGRSRLTGFAGIPFLAVAAVSIAPPGGLSQPIRSDTAPSSLCADLKTDRDPAVSAVRCAERFIARQGYTDSPPTVDSTTIVYEFPEAARTWRGVLEMRRDTLKVPALGVCDFGGDSYDVIFGFTGSNENTGRSVRVSKDLANVQMVHQDFMLRALTNPVQCRAFDKSSGAA